MQNEVPHSISLAQAIDLTTRFRNNRSTDLPICETFEKVSVDAVLATPNATRLRVYLGEKENGDICCVLVAADAEGYDLLPAEANITAFFGEDDPIILEDAMRCPELCPPPSLLNE